VVDGDRADAADGRGCSVLWLVTTIPWIGTAIRTDQTTDVLVLLLYPWLSPFGSAESP